MREMHLLWLIVVQTLLDYIHQCPPISTHIKRENCNLTSTGMTIHTASTPLPAYTAIGNRLMSKEGATQMFSDVPQAPLQASSPFLPVASVSNAVLACILCLLLRG